MFSSMLRTFRSLNSKRVSAICESLRLSSYGKALKGDYVKGFFRTTASISAGGGGVLLASSSMRKIADPEIAKKHGENVKWHLCKARLAYQNAKSATNDDDHRRFMQEAYDHWQTAVSIDETWIIDGVENWLLKIWDTEDGDEVVSKIKLIKEIKDNLEKAFGEEFSDKIKVYFSSKKDKAGHKRKHGKESKKEES